ncbi:GMC oxidoreductase [Athelia psychrophila]|uniref:GMC oxidoreductase n=1 Tax=Athelia psychrophila TaxID=1759441 RepID=A0A166PQI1_9AGAM|nr:GMC oxidoreductase [Fibularhizoctonia sp. CBS 109695]
MLSIWALIPLLSYCSRAFSLQTCHPMDPTTAAEAEAFANTEFDYIIIGGGTSGLAVASRLTEDPSIVVGLIEAGVYHYDAPLVYTPRLTMVVELAGDAIGNTSYDWSYMTVPQPGLAGREIATARGKMLGGSSGLNLMAYTLASEAEYDAFEVFASSAENKTDVVPGWNWAGLKPLFKKSNDVDNQVDPFYGLKPDTKLRSSVTSGTSGPINVSINPWYPDIIAPVVESYNKFGIKTNGDAYSGNSAGVFNARLTINQTEGTRSYVGYYCASATRSNLHILTGARASKILLSESNSAAMATGAQFLVGNQTYTANASKEVILAASTVQTPQLLELSGIGNSTLLKSLGITPLIDLPGVGENLQEHLYSILSYQLTPGHQTYDELRWNVTFQAVAAAQYNSGHGGIYATSDSTASFNPFSSYLTKANITNRIELFDKVANSSKPTPLQVLQYTVQRAWLVNGTVPENEALMWSHNIEPGVGNNSYITFLSGNMHPMARGSIHINSTSIENPPVINPNFFDNEYDVQVVKDSTQMIMDLANTEPLKSQIAATVLPPPIANDTALEAYVRSISTPGSHIIGTAAMAPRAMGGVVDSSLLVYGTTNLRVVDSSTIPLLIATHLQATVWAMAEKAAEIIKAAQ